MRCRSKKDGTNDSVSGRSRRPKEASSACHDSLQQMWTSATKTPSSQKHCNFSFFSLNSLPAAPILYSFPLLPLSLSRLLYVQSAADKWCMPLSLHGYDNIKDSACDDGWMEKDREKERLPGMRNNATSHPWWQPGYTVCFLYTALLFCLGESLSSPPLWFPRPCS